MTKPRLSEGRIPFQLGVDAAGPIALPYQSDAYYYDSGGGTGLIAGGTVQPFPNQESATGSLAGGTVLPSETIYD